MLGGDQLVLSTTEHRLMSHHVALLAVYRLVRYSACDTAYKGCVKQSDRKEAEVSAEACILHAVLIGSECRAAHVTCDAFSSYSSSCLHSV